MSDSGVQSDNSGQSNTSAPTVHQLAVDIAPNKSIDVSVAVPDGSAAPRGVLYCLPGGGMSKKYFDLGGAAKPDYSFMRYFAGRGYLVVSINPTGVGESSGPADSYSLTPKMIADDIALTVKELRKKLKHGLEELGIPPFTASLEIGIGHSMGAMLTILVQAKHELFDALGLLGFYTGGLPQILSKAEQAVIGDFEQLHKRLPEFARKRFRDQQYPRIPEDQHKDSEATEILKPAADVLLPLPAAFSMFPGNVAAEVALLNCPIFIGVGDRDMTGPPDELPGEYQKSPYVTLYVVEKSGHHSFVSEARDRLFSNMLIWTNSQK